MHLVPLGRNEPDKQTPGWERGQANSAKSVLRQTHLSPAPWAYALFSQDLQASGNIEGEKKSWRCCKNSLELIRQSMHIFTNIFSRGGGGGGEKYII